MSFGDQMSRPFSLLLKFPCSGFRFSDDPVALVKKTKPYAHLFDVQGQRGVLSGCIFSFCSLTPDPCVPPTTLVGTGHSQ